MKSTSMIKQAGYHVIGIVILLAVVGVVGAVGFLVFKSDLDNNKASDEVVWAYNDQENKWFTQEGTAPMCKNPFRFDISPVDTSVITGVLFPGSYRGFSYKPHGGFGVPEPGKIDVKMPMDATLVGLSRYYEGTGPDLQYILTFESDCGIAFRFDHLYTLTPEFQALAEQTPEPKLNDTRASTDDNPPRTKFKSGRLVATQVGLPSMKIYGFDFGVYDYRQPNEISKNQEWAAIHNQYESLDWFGVCWFDMLPGNEPDIVKPLSMAQTDTRKTVPKISDYCSNAPHKTLEFNKGQPTDG